MHTVNKISWTWKFSIFIYIYILQYHHCWISQYWVVFNPKAFRISNISWKFIHHLMNNSARRCTNQADVVAHKAVNVVWTLTHDSTECGCISCSGQLCGVLFRFSVYCKTLALPLQHRGRLHETPIWVSCCWCPVHSWYI